MGADQDFNTFLSEWTKERIGPTNDSLGSRHLQELRAELRAIELIQLAKEKGFRDNLTETQKAYGSVLAYVKHLMREADHEAPSSGSEARTARSVIDQLDAAKSQKLGNSGTVPTARTAVAKSRLWRWNSGVSAAHTPEQPALPADRDDVEHPSRRSRN